MKMRPVEKKRNLENTITERCGVKRDAWRNNQTEGKTMSDVVFVLAYV